MPEIDIPAPRPAASLRLPKNIGEAPILPQGARLGVAPAPMASPVGAEQGFGMLAPQTGAPSDAQVITRDQMPADTPRYRKLSHAEIVERDGVECSYIDTKTGKVHPPWEHPKASPEAKAAMLQTYRAAVAREGGAWNPYPDAAK